MRSFYFDYNATTPIAEEVLEVFHRALRDGFGNASSIHHLGQTAKQSLENARRQVVCADRVCKRRRSSLAAAEQKRTITRSSALPVEGERPHVITSAIEHPAVLNAVAEIEQAWR